MEKESGGSRNHKPWKLYNIIYNIRGRFHLFFEQLDSAGPTVERVGFGRVGEEKGGRSLPEGENYIKVKSKKLLPLLVSIVFGREALTST